MSNIIQLQEPEVDTLIQVWTGLQLERGVSASNLGSFQVITQLPYVAGQTVYTYEDLTGAASDWYRTVRYGPGTFGTYSPPWPVKQPPLTVGDGARRSLLNCRRMLARKLGSFRMILTTADGAIDGSSFISLDLANQTDPNRYRSWWVMPTDGVNAGEVRVLGESVVNVSSGQVAIAPPFSTQVVRGTQIEGHRLLPPDEGVGPTIGLRQALNLALSELWVLDRLTVTGTGAASIDISSLGDWLDPEATYELYGAAAPGGVAAPYGPYRVRSDANLTNLDVIGLAAGGTTDLELTRPGDTYMKVNGVWTDSQLGFTSDTDESLFQPAFLTEIALAYCWEALADMSIGTPQTRYQTLAQTQRRKANSMKRMPGALPRPVQHSHGAAVGDEWPMYGTWDRKSYFG
jgi:hypothetical protein